MAHGLYGYSVQLARVEQAVGSNDLNLLTILKERFGGVLALNERWFAAHASNHADLLPLDQALEAIIVSPPGHFEDRTTNVGYALEILCYHFGKPVRLGRAGRGALRDMTLVELTDMIEALSAHVGSTPLDDGFDLKRGLLVRPIAGVEPLAGYPGTGVIRAHELAGISGTLRNIPGLGPPDQQTWGPLHRLFAEATAQRMDLVTFYY